MWCVWGGGGLGKGIVCNFQNVSHRIINMYEKPNWTIAINKNTRIINAI